MRARKQKKEIKEKIIRKGLIAIRRRVRYWVERVSMMKGKPAGSIGGSFRVP